MSFVTFIKRNWDIVSLAAVVLVGIGAAQSQISTIDDRVADIEAEQPAVIRATTNRNTEIIDRIDERLQRIDRQLAEQGRDVAYIRGTVEKLERQE